MTTWQGGVGGGIAGDNPADELERPSGILTKRSSQAVRRVADLPHDHCDRRSIMALDSTMLSHHDPMIMAHVHVLNMREAMAGLFRMAYTESIHGVPYTASIADCWRQVRLMRPQSIVCLVTQNLHDDVTRLNRSPRRLPVAETEAESHSRRQKMPE